MKIKQSGEVKSTPIFWERSRRGEQGTPFLDGSVVGSSVPILGNSAHRCLWEQDIRNHPVNLKSYKIILTISHTKWWNVMHAPWQQVGGWNKKVPKISKSRVAVVQEGLVLVFRGGINLLMGMWTYYLMLIVQPHNKLQNMFSQDIVDIILIQCGLRSYTTFSIFSSTLLSLQWYVLLRLYKPQILSNHYWECLIWNIILPKKSWEIHYPNWIHHVLTLLYIWANTILLFWAGGLQCIDIFLSALTQCLDGGNSITWGLWGKWFWIPDIFKVSFYWKNLNVWCILSWILIQYVSLFISKLKNLGKAFERLKKKEMCRM